MTDIAEQDQPTAGRRRPAVDRNGATRLLPPGHAAFAEVGKLDPDGRGTALYEIVPDQPVRLSPRIRRITAANGNFMTGPGTNTYLVGAGADLAVIDPGPADPVHIEAVLSAAEGRIARIFVTHTHTDHSPAAAALKARTGAELLGMPAPQGQYQDQSFGPDRILRDGDRIGVGGAVLRALHTPGHASNHLCYLLEEERILCTGDHIMQGSTVVIGPPDGDMIQYLESLERLRPEPIDYLAPGHGFLIDDPAGIVDRLVRHRMLREAKTLGALRRLGPVDLETLLPVVYDDVPESRLAVAGRSLLAHLLKLRTDGTVAERDGIWEIA